MHNFYAILGIDKNSPLATLKKSYREKVLTTHPDRGGDNENMVLLQQAYLTLRDPEKRGKYDKAYALYESFDAVSELPDYSRKALPRAGAHFSTKFRKEQAHFLNQFRSTPLVLITAAVYLKPFACELYIAKDTDEISHTDIFSLIHYKTQQYPSYSTCIPYTTLTLEMTVELFLNFLQGEYFGKNLKQITQLFYKENARLKSMNALNEVILWYEGIYEIFSLALEEKIDENKLLLALKKLTDYAKLTVDKTITILTPIFQSKYFRSLFSKALHLSWLAVKSSADLTTIGLFEGQLKTNNLLALLKKQLETKNENSTDYIRSIKLLATFEKQISNNLGFIDKEKSDVFFREKAYLILDWIPALTGLLNSNILSNMLLQAGAYFQKASYCVSKPYIQMADEKLACELYLMASAISHHSTPDTELYTQIHGLHYLLSLRFGIPELNNIIPALQYRCLYMADIFPFFSLLQSHIDFIAHENQILILMRELLHSLLKRIEENGSHDSLNWPIDHSYPVLLYQAYEACLKQWYEKNYSSETEKDFRFKLMHELLKINKWTFSNIKRNINAPWILIKRDEDEWILPNFIIPFPEDKTLDYFTSVKGIEINRKTGFIQFAFNGWEEGDPPSARCLVANDLKELLARKLSSAIFSLDPVDPDMPYHPFNQMRFAPPSLYRSQLFQAMLMADYLLKFLTVGTEVQADIPYDTRSIKELTQHLPKYLKNIIETFQSAARSESIHRFWIEAGELPIAIADGEEENPDLFRVALGDLTMQVKKHKMVRDAEGNLIDATDEAEEGWQFYVLTTLEYKAWEAEKKEFTGRALLFIEGSTTLYFLEDNQTVCTHVFQQWTHLLDKLFVLKRDDNHKIIKDLSAENLIYLLTRRAAAQAGIPHHFSPEYIFAQDFTAHYNEFAHYFPIFARLRELAKASALVRIIEAQYEANQADIQQRKELLANEQVWKEQFDKIFPEILRQLNENFDGLYKTLSQNALRAQRDNQLSDIKRQTGGDCYWDSQRYRAYSAQLNNIFTNELPNHNFSSINAMVGDFLTKNSYDLREALVNQDTHQVIRKLKEAYPDNSNDDLHAAVNANQQAIKKIAVAETKKIIKKNQAHIQEQMDECKILATTFLNTGYGKDKEPEKADGHCLWVPACTRHEFTQKYNRAVYGGVAIASRFQLLGNTDPRRQGLLTQAPVLPANTRNWNNNIGPSSIFCQNVNSNHGGGNSASHSGGAAGNNSRGGGNNNSGSAGNNTSVGRGGGGNNSGGGNNYTHPTGRYTVIADNLSRPEVRTLLAKENFNMPPLQLKKVLECIGAGRVDQITIKLMQDGNVRVARVRSGHTSGYQRFSHEFNRMGETQRVLQTAFDDKGEIEHQKPGQKKDNLYDRKFPKTSSSPSPKETQEKSRERSPSL